MSRMRKTRLGGTNWKVYVIVDGDELLVHSSRWAPTIDDMEVVSKVRGKKYRVVAPDGRDVTSSFPYTQENR